MISLKPSPQLYTQILNQIEYEKRSKQLKQKLIFYVSLTLISSVIFSLLFKDFSHQASESGFMQFGSLLFSDFRETLRNFSDYILSIAGSLPVMSFGLVSAAVLLVLFGAIKILGGLLEFRKLKHLH